MSGFDRTLRPAHHEHREPAAMVDRLDRCLPPVLPGNGFHDESTQRRGVSARPIERRVVLKKPLHQVTYLRPRGVCPLNDWAINVRTAILVVLQVSLPLEDANSGKDRVVG